MRPPSACRRGARADRVAAMVVALAGLARALPAQAAASTRDLEGLPPPRVAAAPVSAHLLRVVVTVDSIPALHGSWLMLEVLARGAGDSATGRASVRRGHLADTILLAARPATRYAIVARAQSPVVREPVAHSSWSDPVEVATGPAPTRAPAPVRELRASAATPFAVDLAWAQGDEAPDGVAIEYRSTRDSAWRRITIVDGIRMRWRHHARRPGTSGAYRVIAFNAAGIAAPSAAARAKTPRVLAAPPEPADAAANPLEPCVARDAALAEEDEAGGPPTVVRRIPFGRHVVDMRLEQCGNANCVVTLLGVSRSCYRPIARLFFVAGRTRAHPGWLVLGIDRAGWPILALGSHASASSGGREVVQQFGGRYWSVDGASICDAAWDVASRRDGGDPGVRAAEVPLAALRPPFAGCQFDDDP